MRAREVGGARAHLGLGVLRLSGSCWAGRGGHVGGVCRGAGRVRTQRSGARGKGGEVEVEARKWRRGGERRRRVVGAGGAGRVSGWACGASERDAPFPVDIIAAREIEKEVRGKRRGCDELVATRRRALRSLGPHTARPSTCGPAVQPCASPDFICTTAQSVVVARERREPSSSSGSHPASSCSSSSHDPAGLGSSRTAAASRASCSRRTSLCLSARGANQ